MSDLETRLAKLEATVFDLRAKSNALDAANAVLANLLAANLADFDKNVYAQILENYMKDTSYSKSELTPVETDAMADDTDRYLKIIAGNVKNIEVK